MKATPRRRRRQQFTDQNKDPEITLRIDRLVLAIDEAPVEAIQALDQRNRMKRTYAFRPGYKSARSVVDSNSKTLAQVFFNSHWGRPEVIVSCNPARIRRTGVRELISELCKASHGSLNAAFLFNAARVIQCDVAIDLRGVSIEEIELVDARKRKIQQFFGQGGRLTKTIQWGRRKGPREGRVYGLRNGRAQLVVYDWALKNDIPGPVTRIERRIRPKGLKLSDLHALANPFEKLMIYQCPISQLERMGYLGLLIRDCVEVRGLQAALKVLPLPLRNKIKKLVQEDLAQWWKPVSLWRRWPRIVTRAGLSHEDYLERLLFY